MPTACTTCAHPRLADIHAAIDADKGINATARDFGIPPATLKLHLRHRDREHGQDEVSAVEGDLSLDDLEGRLRQITRTSDRLRAEAEHGTVRERREALAECRKTVQTMIALAERIAKGREPDLLTSPQWAAVKKLVIDALRPHPEALAAVVDALTAYGDPC